MKTKLFFVLFLFFIIFTVLFAQNVVNAQADLSITDTSISFSEESFLADNMIRVYVRVWNTSDIDAQGFVEISLNDNQIGSTQPISLKAGTYDDIFLDWLANTGVYDIKAEIVDVSPEDINAENNIVLIENLFVDFDTDQDGVGNNDDLDDDNDTLLDQNEAVIGTNPLLVDTDNDGVNDPDDVFPLDPSEWSDNDNDNLGDNIDPDDDNDNMSDEDEILIGIDSFSDDTDQDGIKDDTDVFPLDINEWLDSDNDGIGDNTDLDNDNDGISDEEELIIGTNPLTIDTDEDGFSDSEEMFLSTDPLQVDSDKDGTIDSQDFFPKDPKKSKKVDFSIKIVLSVTMLMSGLLMLYAILKMKKNIKRF